MTRVFCAFIATLLLAGPAAATKLKVLATFSILGDMVERVAGDCAEVTTLIGANADVHAFEPTAADARAVAEAKLIFANGVGFEPWLDRLTRSTNSRAQIINVTSGLAVRGFEENDDREGPKDPHFWQAANNAVRYVIHIADALQAADPVNAAAYKANADAYLQELRALDVDIRAMLADIPQEKRRVITTHDAFGYFAKAYRVQFLAPLGVSTEEQPSAKALARLITQIRREKITAVFLENIADPRLIETIARETGVELGGKLYSDALSTKSGPAPTYVAMMRHNARLLTAAMAKGS